MSVPFRIELAKLAYVDTPPTPLLVTTMSPLVDDEGDVDVGDELFTSRFEGGDDDDEELPDSDF